MWYLPSCGQNYIRIYFNLKVAALSGATLF